MLGLPLTDGLDMNRCMTRSMLLAIGLALFANGVNAATEAADSAAAKARLAEVRSQIVALTVRLGAQLKDRDALASRLRDADLQLTTARRQLDGLRTAQSALERRRTELRVEANRTQGSLDAERGVLAAEVRGAYMIGQQARLKMLLSQSDPAAAGRALAFYGYFTRQQAVRIDEIRGRTAHLQELVTQIEEAGTKVQTLQTDTQHQLSDLQRIRVERVAALAAVMSQVNSGSEQLAQLKREELAKEALLAELARVLQDFPIDPQQSFDAMRGKLSWPVAGAMTASPARNGVQIDAARGARVRAPYFGRVVYADWLQGLGLLLIIGHSGNYMTLYGHAEVLYKSVGDWVAPGDLIAAMSESGGTAPLYFEIRSGRKTVDPRVWLKASP